MKIAFEYIRQILQHAAGGTTSTAAAGTSVSPLRRYSGVTAGLRLLAGAPPSGPLGDLMLASHKELLGELTKVNHHRLNMQALLRLKPIESMPF